MASVPSSVRFSTSPFQGVARDEAEGEGCLHRVDAAGAGLVDHIASVIDYIGIVAVEANHGVGARTAVEFVGGRVADEHVIELAARPVYRGRTKKRQILDTAPDGAGAKPIVEEVEGDERSGGV